MKSRKRVAVDRLEDAIPPTGGKGIFPASQVTALAADTNLSPPPSPTSRQFFRKPSGMERIFALSPKPTAVLDKELRIIAASDAYQKLFNADPALGKNLFDVVGKVLAPTDYAVIVRLVQDAIDTRKQQRSEPRQRLLLVQKHLHPFFH